jgi:FkbM family methyltransferase
MIIRNNWHFPDFDTHFADFVLEFPQTTYQQSSIDEAYKFVKSFGTVIDVGANIGLHSVRFAQKFANVHSFEPVHGNFECLVKNTECFKNVTLYNQGLGETSKIENISIPANNNNCGLYSIVDFVNFTDQLTQESIKISRLDDFNLTPDLIKMDTQGFELFVLRGGLQTLINYKPVLIIEIDSKKNYREIFNLLSPLGFKNITSQRHDKIWVYEK